MQHVSSPASYSAAPAAKAGLAVPRMFVLMLAAWLFDFQSGGEGEGVDIQAYFAAAYGFGLVMLLIGDRAVGKRIQGLPALMVCGGLYLGVGIASGLVNGQQLYPLLRNVMSVAIYLSAAYATARVVLSSDPARLRLVLAVFCLLYAGSAFIMFNLTSGGIDYDRVRFQIVGASSIAALGYVVLAALFRLGKIEMAAVVVNAVFVLLSITRSFLVVVGVQGSVFLGKVRQVFSPRLIMLGMAGVVALVGVIGFGQRQVVRWEERIGGSGSGYVEYQTVYTRLSEWDFMLSDWTKSSDHFLFGSGMAARTTYYKPRELGGGSEYMIGFGHNQHLSLLFTSGAVGGLPLLFLQFFQGFLAWRFLRRTINYPHLRNDAVFLGAWGATMILGNLAANTLAAAFSVRGISLWLGIGTGLLLGAQALFDPENAPRRPRAAAPRASRYLPA